MATRAFRVQSSGSRKIAFTILSMRHQYTAVSKTVQIIFGRIVEIACSYACAYESGATDQRTDADDPIPTSLVERTRALRGRKRIEKFRRAEVEGRRAIEDQRSLVVHDANVLLRENCPNIDLIVLAHAAPTQVPSLLKRSALMANLLVSNVTSTVSMLNGPLNSAEEILTKLVRHHVSAGLMNSPVWTAAVARACSNTRTGASMTVAKPGYDELAPTWTQALPDRLRDTALRLPRPFRFLMVGGFGFITDIGFFTLFSALGAHVLIARALSLGLAAVVTWRLNRHLTFADRGRHQTDEATRYALVAAVAQGLGYAIFAVLALTVLSKMPQIAIAIGAAAVTFISYNGQRLITFAPRKALAPSSISIYKAAP